jgi:hypothetical protein
VTSEKLKAFICAHSIAETYAALTRLPVQPRTQLDQAARIVHENILPYFTIVTLERGDYVGALDTVGARGWSGYALLTNRLPEAGLRGSGAEYCAVRQILETSIYFQRRARGFFTPARMRLVVFLILAPIVPVSGPVGNGTLVVGPSEHR